MSCFCSEFIEPNIELPSQSSHFNHSSEKSFFFLFFCLDSINSLQKQDTKINLYTNLLGSLETLTKRDLISSLPVGNISSHLLYLCISVLWHHQNNCMPLKRSLLIRNGKRNICKLKWPFLHCCLVNLLRQAWLEENSENLIFQGTFARETFVWTFYELMDKEFYHVFK